MQGKGRGREGRGRGLRGRVTRNSVRSLGDSAALETACDDPHPHAYLSSMSCQSLSSIVLDPFVAWRSPDALTLLGLDPHRQ